MSLVQYDGVIPSIPNNLEPGLARMPASTGLTASSLSRIRPRNISHLEDLGNLKAQTRLSAQSRNLMPEDEDKGASCRVQLGSTSSRPLEEAIEFGSKCK